MDIIPDAEKTETATPKQDIDWFLTCLIGNAEGGLETGLTLTVGGTLISGILISSRSYFEELSRAMDSATVHGAHDASNVRKTLADAYKTFAEMYPPKGEPEKSTTVPRNFIHLRHAQFVGNPDQHFPSEPGTLMRIKASAVDGYIVGNLTPG